eukprot:m.30512 g.30512  ORF g.30512 m.30512 type:complete len:357 (+) comp6803_c0_seq1:24-1094(+)
MAANGGPAAAAAAAPPKRRLDWSLSSSLGNLAWLNRLMPATGEDVAQGGLGAKEAQPDYTQDPDNKPPYAYNLLIYEAIKACDKDKVTLGEIYTKIMEKYAYYRMRPKETAWKNSIRHNLTVHDCFVKINRDKSKNETGKGGFWTVDEELAKEDVDFGPKDPHKVGNRNRKRRRQEAAVDKAGGKASKKMNAAPSQKKKQKAPSGKQKKEAVAMSDYIYNPDPADNLDRYDVAALEGSALPMGPRVEVTEDAPEELDVSSFMADDFSESQILKTLASNLANDIPDDGPGENGGLNPGASGVFGNSFAKLVGSIGGMGGMKSFSGLFNESFVGMFAQPPPQSSPSQLSSDDAHGHPK